jgi:REP element-mobilizing transposase RayT
VNRANVFFEEKNYAYFMRTYQRYIPPVAELFAFCLLRNHFHLLIRIRPCEEIELQQTAKVSQQFSNFFNAYAKSINKAYGRTGSLFQHPFGRRIVRTGAYFVRAVCYIHQNPQRHGLVSDFRDWPHSSYRNFFASQPGLIQRDEVLEWFGGIDGFVRLHGEDIEIAPPGLAIE